MTDATMTGAVPRPRTAPAHAVPPAWWPGRIYYGWALVGALGLTATVSYGILSYGFAVFVTPMGAELGWSKTQITGAFSVAQLVAGVAAIPVGRWVDRHGARALMTAGSVLAACLLVAWSGVRSLPAFYALWGLMGLAMAAVLYEPAFAVVATWFRRDRGRALTALTFMGGFAAVVFVPLVTLLVERLGWRDALLSLAALYAVLTIVPHGVVLRRRPADTGLLPDGATRAQLGQHPTMTPSRARSGAPSVPAHAAVRSRSFRWLAVSFGLSALATTAVSVHLVPLLLERGYGAGFAGAAMGVLGLMALPGRLVFTPLGDRWPRSAVTASIFVLQGVAAVTMLSNRSTTAVWAFVALFGAGFGAITPARAALVGELFGTANYGQISGVLALLLSLARAAAPVGASLLYGVGGPVRRYDAVLAAIALLAVGSVVAVLGAEGGAPRCASAAHSSGSTAA
jgi:MFS family permease